MPRNKRNRRNRWTPPPCPPWCHTNTRYDGEEPALVHYRPVGAVQVPHYLIANETERLTVGVVRWDFGGSEPATEGPWIQVETDGRAGDGGPPRDGQRRQYTAAQAREVGLALIAAADVLELADAEPDTLALVCRLSDRLGSCA